MTEPGRFGRVAATALAVSIVGFATTLVSSVVVSRALGAQGKGEFSLFQAAAVGLILLSAFDVGAGQMYWASRDPRLLKHFMANGYTQSAIEGLIAAAIFLIVRTSGTVPWLDHLDAPAAIAGVLAVPLVSALIFQRQYLLTTERYTLSKANFALSQFLPLVAYVALIAFGRSSVEEFVIAFVVSQAACVVVFHVIVRRFMTERGTVSKSFAFRSFTFGFRQYLSDVTLFLTSRLDFLVVAVVLGTRQLGIYSVAVALGEITNRLPSEVGTLLFPAFASQRLTNERAAPILRKMLFMSLVTAGVLGLISGPLIELLFGPSFSDAIPAFRLLLVGTVAWGTIYVTWNHAAAAGRPGIGAQIFGLAAVVDTGLNLVLLPRLGVSGASIAASISYWLAAACFLRVFCQSIGCTMREALVIRRSDVRELVGSIRQAGIALLRRPVAS